VTTSHSLPSSPPAGSVLDGDPRVLVPLPEAAERLGISRWQAAAAASRPLGWVRGICTCRRRYCAASSKKASP
jgi:hypothetical protein